MNQIKNFLSKEECDYLISLIDENNAPSMVVSEGAERDKYDRSRTSSTCNLPVNDAQVKEIHQRIADKLGVDISKGESLQGQMYKPGQYFRPHNDWFGPGSAYNKHCLHSGNRTNTLMIYLNDDFEGGATDFARKKITVKPELGKAVTWTNLLEDGSGDQDSLHEGQDVISGTKYIVTSWWRQKSWDGHQDSKLYNESLNKPKVYTDYKEIPKLSPYGFKLIKCPKETWDLIQESYSILKEKEQEEVFEGKETVIKGTSKSSLLSFDNLPEVRTKIHDQLQPVHEEWIGRKLEKTFIYGIRSYGKGANLIMHRDRVETHHISSIIMVDKDLRCGCQNKEFGNDWGLDIVDHNGQEHKVFMEPGDVLLYESAVCLHGRKDNFEGNFYRNFYVHYKLV
jgi:prolyl 4-hydroxylase